VVEEIRLEQNEVDARDREGQEISTAFETAILFDRSSCRPTMKRILWYHSNQTATPMIESGMPMNRLKSVY